MHIKWTAVNISSSNVDPGDHQVFSKGEQVLYLASFPTSNIFFFSIQQILNQNIKQKVYLLYMITKNNGIYSEIHA